MKKFLAQDFSGDALAQFRYEVRARNLHLTIEF